VDWIDLAWDGDKRMVLLSMVMNFRFCKMWEILGQRFLKKRLSFVELVGTAGISSRNWAMIYVIVDLFLFQVAMATGQVLFQRFYYSKSFVRHAMETTAMGCVCLASKIEEAPRRIRDVINVFHHIKQVKSQK
jgi:hypothetical protein